MTTPYERTKSVIETRQFLQMLASADDVTIRGLVQSVAVCLLRHYPLDIDLEVSAAALPGVWVVPERQRSDGTAVAKQTGSSFLTGERDGNE
ncbi:MULTISPECIES: BPSL0761 family protein [Paraburkholderia]|uniref:Uncharacterized protein n=1 Tax=Paraburkholderia podalyriae TaxID=1938811 RepID=A0ABR7PG50_9BURK|nr:BPSL0761 family protein [Paraburkholderia podalyriae]MBC8745338.1 hypothetical protein [Paraburkholderia podalyriae]